MPASGPVDARHEPLRHGFSLAELDDITGTPPPRVRARRDIGITDEELAQRHKNGESLRSLAAELPLSRTAIRDRIQPHL